MYVLKGVLIADIDATKGAEAVSNINKEYGGNTAVFVKTDVTNVGALEGTSNVYL